MAPDQQKAVDVFGRKKRSDEGDEAGAGQELDDLADYALSPEDQELEDAELLAEIDARLAAEESSAEVARPQGPWDAEDAPDDELSRIDLGGLRVPVPEGTEVRVDVGPDGTVVAATLVQGESSMQVNAFAAPRKAGIWADVRTEIAEALNGSQGSAVEQDGPYGTELRAQVPAEDAQGGATGLAPARFLGVDGPRWFLRALLTGPAAVDPAAAAGLEAALRDVVVVRGDEAMAVRDPLPLVLPADVAESAEAAAAEAAEAAQGGSGLQVPERGPEITETR